MEDRAFHGEHDISLGDCSQPHQWLVRLAWAMHLLLNNSFVQMKERAAARCSAAGLDTSTHKAETGGSF